MACFQSWADPLHYEERNHSIRGIAPCRADGQEFLPQRTVGKGFQLGQSRLDTVTYSQNVAKRSNVISNNSLRHSLTTQLTLISHQREVASHNLQIYTLRTECLPSLVGRKSGLSIFIDAINVTDKFDPASNTYFHDFTLWNGLTAPDEAC